MQARVARTDPSVATCLRAQASAAIVADAEAEPRQHVQPAPNFLSVGGQEGRGRRALLLPLGSGENPRARIVVRAAASIVALVPARLQAYMLGRIGSPLEPLKQLFSIIGSISREARGGGRCDRRCGGAAVRQHGGSQTDPGAVPRRRGDARGRRAHVCRKLRTRVGRLEVWWMCGWKFWWTQVCRDVLDVWRSQWGRTHGR
mmetsp:Transcript_28940/g.74399  ORF Transcript_28940/g.74399 Transcript_28940/m.74399 type:complete len:202 (-) Transcript_28940:241-846(-)